MSGAADNGRYDDPAEKAVLGAVLLENDCLNLLEGIVTAGDFYVPENREVYSAMVALRVAGKPIDIETLAHELRCRNKLNSVGGAHYLGELTDKLPTIAHCVSHAQIVAEHARSRAVIELARGIVLRESRLEVRADDLVRFAREGLAHLPDPSASNGLTQVGDALDMTFAKLEAAGSHGTSGLTTGFRDLDDKMAGMHQKAVTIIAGRPAMGKTSFALRSMRRAAEAEVKRAALIGRQPWPLVIFSLEMGTAELAARLLCADARVDSNRLRTGLVSQDDMTRLVAAANELCRLPLFIDEGTDLTLHTMRAKLSYLVRIYGGIAGVWVDYLQLMKSGEKHQSREQEISEISRGMKVIAKELSFPMQVLSQLNRDCEKRPGKDKRPMLADLRESGSIEQDADNVLFIYRDEVYNRESPDRGIAEIIIAKQRNGPTDTVRLRFVRELTDFQDLEEREAAEFPTDTSRGGLEDQYDD